MIWYYTSGWIDKINESTWMDKEWMKVLEVHCEWKYAWMKSGWLNFVLWMNE